MGMHATWVLYLGEGDRVATTYAAGGVNFYIYNQISYGKYFVMPNSDNIFAIDEVSQQRSQ